MDLRLRIVLVLELLVGVVPVTAFYLYLFPAGLFWARAVIESISHGILNTFTILIAAVFVLGGVGLISLWSAVIRRLAGRGSAGRLLTSGMVAGMTGSIILLSVLTILGAYWLDYFLYGGPLLVAAHQIVATLRSRGVARARQLGAAVVALLLAGLPGKSLASVESPRVPAEWEPALGAMVAWPPIVPDALLVEIAKDDRLFLIVEDAAARSEAEAALGKLAIDPKRVQFLVAKAGDGRSWPRDWGPFPLFDAQGAFHLADPLFVDYPGSTPSCDGRLYGERVVALADFRADDAATEVVARTLGLSRLQLPFGFTGGNALVDGLGTAFSTCVMLNENRRFHGVPEGELRRLVATNLGITNLVVLPNFEWFGIQHVDCLLKPLDEETLLVKRVPEGHPDHDSIESIVRHLGSLTNPRGRPYRIVRIDTPPYLLRYFVANYTNSLILNRKILVPLFGIPADQEALETWRRSMPGYEVIGFENKGPQGWSWLDALHCRVRAVWDPEMLSMSHRRIDDPVRPAASYRFEATILDHSRAGLVREDLLLSWRLKGETTWRPVRLEPASVPDTFAAEIPSPGPGRTVEYYLSAADRSGRRETLPRTAPKGYYTFSITPAH